MWRWLWLILVLAGCTTVLPRPAPELSILALPNKSAVYIPLTIGKQNLGRGVGLTYGICADAEAVDANWYINWGVTGKCQNTSHVPVVFGEFKTCPIIPGNGLVLGFNEPDRPDQANLTPERGAELWYRLTVDCYPGRQFGTPTIINEMTWLTDWWQAYYDMYEQTPNVQILSIHCYSWTGADRCINFVQEARAWGQARGIYQIIIPEYAILPCNIGHVAGILEADRFRSWLETQPDVIGAAWFAARIYGDEWWWFKPGDACNTSLVDKTGKPSVWGLWYSR